MNEVRNGTALEQLQTFDLVFCRERLLFRPLDESGLELSIELWTNLELTRFVGGPADSKTLVTEHQTYMRRCAGGAIGVWTLTLKKTEEKIGTAILLPMPTDKDDTDWDLLIGGEMPPGDIEIGYILKKDFWGKGYATEACMRLLKFGFENTNLDTIVASTDRANTASQRVLQKSGMEFVGDKLSYNEICPFFQIGRSQWMERQS